MKKDTKQQILKQALNLFAKHGYDSVRVAQIAEAVNIKAPSLYKHYKSKEDIFKSILVEMEQRYIEQVQSVELDGVNPGTDANFLVDAGTDKLLGIAKQLFEYYLHDEFASQFRRMLVVEQFHSSELANIYTEQYIKQPLKFQGTLFGVLIKSGDFCDMDSEVMALHFYSPIFLLLSLCDCKPEMEAEATTLLEKNILQFERLYRKK